ncbi:hypothetical protein [Ralstonia insidiosa]|uniref:hypothetical protein n=1 Tax=Ralstonia insidiosa TaxID=190721 RepID=UPI0007DC02E9|nr:hypothetical protein [Ralstonia insidiosa]
MAIGVLLTKQAHAGILLPEDLAAAQKEFRSSVGIDADKYTVNSKLTGCALRTCENMAPRHAVFERVLSAETADVLRVARYQCDADNRLSLQWKCDGPYASGLIAGRGIIGLAFRILFCCGLLDYIDDNTIVGIVEYANGDCFREQAHISTTDNRRWRISAILSIEGYYVLSLFDDIFEVKQFYLRPLENSTHTCHFQILKTGGAVF